MSGDVVSVEYPFVRCVAGVLDEDGPSSFVSWRPGVAHRWVGPKDSEAFANGIGKMHLTVVSTHKPGNWPERVFYTREWERPDGKRFGRRRLLIATRHKFTRLCRGYGHPFIVDMDEEPDDVREFLRMSAA